MKTITLKSLAMSLLALCISFEASAGTYVPAGIESIEPSQPHDGVVRVTVRYDVQPCKQRDLGIFTHEAPMNLGAPDVAVGVLLDDSGFECMGPLFRKTATFEVPAIAGQYQFHAVQPNVRN